MLDHNTSPNIRVKKTFPVENYSLKSVQRIGQTRYSEPFGKFFINKNKDRINLGQSGIKTNKYSERYFVNLNKLEKIADGKKQPQQINRPHLNRTLSSSVNHDDFNATNTIQKYSSTTSQSHRSHILTVNLKHLPKICPPSSNFNGSHTKIETIKEEINNFGLEVISMITKTRDFKITFDKTKNHLQNHCNQSEKNMNTKILELQKLINNTQQNSKNRTQALQQDCLVIKQKNIELKAYLHEIQSRIEEVENSLGITTAHHKHYV